MTDEETDAGVGRLVKRYADTKKRIACIRSRTQEMGKDAERARMSLRNMHLGDYEQTKAGFDAVDWSGISDALGKLVELKIEMDRIEECLRGAGLGDLIR